MRVLHLRKPYSTGKRSIFPREAREHLSSMRPLLLANSVALGALIDALRVRRPVFHSESDFRHAFAWTARELEPSLHIRLELRPEPDAHLDILLSQRDCARHTAVELIYLTDTWHGSVDDEQFHLEHHGAHDTRCYDVVKDLERVERLVARHPGWDGLVLVLSNDPRYWHGPDVDAGAQAFSLEQGTLLHGTGAWGDGGSASDSGPADVELAGRYSCFWSGYTALPGDRGTFRLLTLAVRPTNRECLDSHAALSGAPLSTN
jgi:hypothetical protein